MENFSTRQQAAALQSALGIRAQSAGQFCKKGSGQMRLMMLSSQRLTLSCKTFSNKVCKVCLEIANNTTDQHLHHSILQTASVPACFPGFGEWGCARVDDDIFPVAPRISESVYISNFAKNVSFVPSSALFPFNDSFAVNLICKQLK